MTPAERVEARLDKSNPDGCWRYTGAIHQGYGRLGSVGIHRIMYEAHKGPIPAGLVIDHMCRTRSCGNPDHLRAVTPRVNALENSIGPLARNAVATHCPAGHEYTPDNIIPRRGWRQCRTCELARKQVWQKNNRDQVNAHRKEWRRKRRERAHQGDQP